MATVPSNAAHQGSIVLVTGANGFLGSHIVDQFLQRGYRVRGVVRNVEKSSWMTDFFASRYGKGVLELHEVPDLLAPNALDPALQGVTILIHTVSELSFGFDPNVVVTGSVNLAAATLSAAYKQPSVKRFVHTSSGIAVAFTHPSLSPQRLTEASYNQLSVEKAWEEPPYTQGRALHVYGASKVQAEQKVFEMYKENKERRPDLVVNSVIPTLMTGEVLSPAHQVSTTSAAYVGELWKGNVSFMHQITPANYFIDVKDAARLFVAAAILPGVEGRRVFGYGGKFNFDRILDIMREHAPGRKLPDNFQSGWNEDEIVERDFAEGLLKQLGQPGWTSLKDSVLDSIKHIEAE